MDATANGGSAADLTPTTPAAAVSNWTFALSRRYQHLLDRCTPHILYRWIAFGAIAIIYVTRVCILQGFYVVSYALGICVINLLIEFLSPKVDPAYSGQLEEGPALPTRASDEFRPFVRRLPEFKFWYSVTKAFCFAFVLTFFSAFDVPVFWPILLLYWIILFTLTMRKQIQHMIKYKYVPFSSRKQRFDGNRAPSAENESLAP